MILGALLNWLLYPLLIMAPLHILNALYKVFEMCCSAEIGKLLFGGQTGSLKWDFNSPLMRYILMALIVGAVVFAALLFVLAVEKARGKQLNWTEKLKWPVAGILSVVMIPAAFMLFTGMATAVLSLFGGNTTAQLLQLTHLSSITSSFLGQSGVLLSELAQSFNVNIVLKDATEANVVMQMKQAIEILTEAVQNVAKSAATKGLSDIINQCNNIIKNLGELRNQLGQIQSICETLEQAISQWFVKAAGQKEFLMPDDVAFNQIKEAYNKLEAIHIAWNEVITSCIDLNKNSFLLTDVADITKKIGDKDCTFKAWAVIGSLKAGFDPSASLTNFKGWDLFNKFWSSGESSKCLWVLMNEGSKEDIDWIGVFNPSKHFTFKISEQCYLSAIMSGCNKDSVSTFNLVNTIYKIVTGRSDGDWSGYHPYGMRGGISILNIGIGFVLILASSIVTGMFALYAARRLIELALIAVFTIVTAFIGVKDDGVKFTANLRLFIGKTFTIVIVYAFFSIGLGITSIINDAWSTQPVGTGGFLAQSIMNIVIIVGGLLGSYGLAQFFGKQFGDNNSLSSTMMDLGVLKTAAKGAALVTGAGALAKFAGSKAKNVAKHGASKLGDNLKSGLASKTGLNFFNKGSSKANAGRLANVNATAEKMGLGQTRTILNEKGEAKDVFEFNPQMKDAAAQYNNMLSDKRFNDTYREGGKKQHFDDSVVKEYTSKAKTQAKKGDK